jgi:hypothetical protein
MTWQHKSHDATLNVDHVGCGTCEPYVGDTLCTESLPILCFNETGVSNPGIITDSYNGWASGELKLTTETQGCDLTSETAANTICSTQFGSGWRIAEFHDGDGIGWNFYAYGDIQATSRFWTHINDQPANCWDQMSTP